MSLQTLNTNGQGFVAANMKQLRDAVKELQGLNVTIIPTGAAANTKMNIAAMRTEDTILAVRAEVTASGVVTDDTANVTIQDTHASGTLTANVVVAGNSCVVNGVTYTARAAPTLPNEWLVAGVNATDVARLVAVINAYENRFDTAAQAFNVPRVLAVATSGTVITITALDDGAGNGPVITNSANAAVVSTDPNAVTATCVSMVADDTITVNGVVFTVKASPTTNVHIKLGATDAAQGTYVRDAVNSYQSVVGGLDVVVTNVLGVVTFAAGSARKGNNIVLTGTATRLAASGSGYLANGTATGGIKSTSTLSASDVTVFWFNKR